MDSHIIKQQVLETQYTQVMGHMDVISIISDGFNVYFPIAILLFCLATYFSLGSRILSIMGFHQFVGDDEITTDLVDDGRELIKRENANVNVQKNRQTSEKELEERFPGTGRFGTRNSTDAIRPVNRELLESTRSNLLRNTENIESYEGTRFNSGDIDTSFLPDNSDDINIRFGVSTHKVINERYGGREGSESTPADSFQGRNYKRVGPPPRGIFDDV